MLNRFLTGVLVALALSPSAFGCRGGEKKSSVTCQVVHRSIREVAGGALEVAVSVRWSVRGQNYRTNKPISVGRFDPKEQTRAALEERFKPGAEVECSIDPAQPTRIHLANAR